MPKTRLRRRLPEPASRQLNHETLEKRELLAADIADFVVFNDGDRISYEQLSIEGDFNNPRDSALAFLQSVEPESDFQLIGVTNGFASSHARFQRVVDGIPVFGTAASVHLNSDGVIQSLHLETKPDLIQFRGGPAISSNLAVEAAGLYNGIESTISAPITEQVWYENGDGTSVLAWETSVSSAEPAGEFRTIVDASSGAVLESQSDTTGDDDVSFADSYQGNSIDFAGAIDEDSEIWSRALWDIRAVIGDGATDQLVLEHRYALPFGATLPDAARAILLANNNINGGANESQIRQAFVDQGILAPTTYNPPTSLTASFSASASLAASTFNPSTDFAAATFNPPTGPTPTVPLEKEDATGPRLLGVNPNAGELFDEGEVNFLQFSPTQLTFRFDGGQQLDPSTFAGGIRVTPAGNDGTFDGDEIPITPGFLGFGDNEQTVIMRFAETLADDRYRIEIFGEDDGNDGITAVRNQLGDAFRTIDGESFQSIDFDVELGGRVIAVVQQPIDSQDGISTRRGADIDVYFDDADLFRPGSTIGDAAFYQLVDTAGTATTEDDFSFAPDSVTIDPVLQRVTLTFPSNLENLVPGNDPISFRLRIGDDVAFQNIPVTPFTPSSEPGISVSTAFDLSGVISTAEVDGNFSLLLDQQISNGTLRPLANSVGASDEIGHRDIETITSGGSERHTDDSDTDNLITVVEYTFLRNDPYGVDPFGTPLFNAVNAQQEARFREILDIYSAQAGVQFVETENSGLRLIVGDLSILDPTRRSEAGGILGLASDDVVIIDTVDFPSSDSSDYGGLFFQTAIHEVGHTLGLDHAYDLRGSVVSSAGVVDNVFPGLPDVVHLNFLHQAEALDVDLYEINLQDEGTLQVQTIAERLSDASLLDSRLTLYRQQPGGLELVAQNDDYFGNDAFIEFEIDQQGVYYIGVAADGNDTNDVESGLTSEGGRSEGNYNLRVEFKSSTTTAALTDGDGSKLDGDRDGQEGGNYNYWFTAANVADTIYVRKPDAAPDIGGVGTLNAPLDNIDDAFALAATRSNAVVRVLPNDGVDNDITTLGDNVAYEVGFIPGINTTLEDGRDLIVPANTTLVIDAGAILKFRDARVSVGSDDNGIDRSGSAIQVLGTPQLPVRFTSFDDHSIAVNANPNDNTPIPGNWGGLDIRNDVDAAQGRQISEQDGIFPNYINHAIIQYAGGSVSSAGGVIAPINLSEARVEASFNTIIDSGNAAISADPNTFLHTTFVETAFQAESVSPNGFVPDYERIGPDLHGNFLARNATNGLFIRIDTLPGNELERLDVTARLDDTDIVHVLGESLLVNGQSGGPIQESVAPSPILGLTPSTGGNLAADTYFYRYTLVDQFGGESISSAQQSTTVGPDGSVILSGFPAVTGDFVSRRLYRSNGGAFFQIAELDGSSSVFVDRVASPAANAIELDVVSTKNRARPDAGLVIDPGIIFKSQGARIELGFGANLIAEGTEDTGIVFTSRGDDRFGAGGTFDTSNDGPSVGTPGEWSGLYAAPTSRISIDHATLAFGGGISGLEGSTAGFNVVEIHQADARIANSTIEFNAEGQGGQSDPGRENRQPNSVATIFVNGSQPIFVGNTFVNNGDGDTQGAVISINANSLDAELRQDTGRQTGAIGLFDVPPGNNGPLIRGNALDGNDINAVQIRGGELYAESVWDDTDIVHVLREDIISTNFHVSNGLRLESSGQESLVVKLDNGAELLATGEALDIDDRIGGRIQVLGTPSHPVVLTSIHDCTVGSGFSPDGFAMNDTLGSGACSTLVGPSAAAPGDWQGITLDPFSHDRNVDTAIEFEGAIGGIGDENGVIAAAQQLGELAPGEFFGDENRRLGFTVHGSIAAAGDQDIYSFRGTAGTLVWFDIDQTDESLDTVLEILDGNGNVLALSDDSRIESINGELTYVNPSDVVTGDTIGFAPGHALPTQLNPDVRINELGGGIRDFNSINDGDSALRAVLPGTTGTTLTYYVRVRSSNSADLTDPVAIQNSLTDGETQGSYQLSVRLQERDEVGGSIVRYADIRYATTGVQAIGLPGHSPLTGDVAHPGGGATLDLDGLGNTDRAAISASAQSDDPATFRFAVGRDNIQDAEGGAGEDARDNRVSVVIDVDYADGLSRANLGAYLYNAAGELVAIGTNSNVLDDRVSPTLPNQPGDPSVLDSASYGPSDPFIGPLELSAGTDTIPDFQVTVANNSQIPADLLQFTNLNAPNTDFRLEPIDSSLRIVDDRFGAARDEDFFDNTDLPHVVRTDENPLGQVAFNADGSNIVEHHIGDVTLIGFNDSGGSQRIAIHNPFNGERDGIIGSTSDPVGAVAQANDGRVIAISQPLTGGTPSTDANTSPTFSVEGDGSTTPLNNTGISTFQNAFAANGDSLNVAANDGAEFSSLAFFGTQFLYGAANRGNFTGINVGLDANLNLEIVGPANAPTANNIIYRLNPNTGEAISRQNRDLNAGFEAANPNDPALTFENNQFYPAETPFAGTNVVAQIQIPQFSPTTGQFIGNIADLVTDINGDDFLYIFTDQGAIWRAEIARITLVAGNGSVVYAPGDIIGEAVLIEDPSIGGGIRNANGDLIIFDEVTVGPENYFHPDRAGVQESSVYYGVTDTGELTRQLVTFDLDTGETEHGVFRFGVHEVEYEALVTGTLDGLFFSAQDSTLWHTTGLNGTSLGSGLPELDSDARSRVLGGTSLRFGSTIGGVDGYNFLGGAHGSVTSNEVDLSGVSAEDLPTLYFNHSVDADGRGTNTDAFRLYVAGDDGVWSLVATNNFNADAGGLDWQSIGEFSETNSNFTSSDESRFTQQLFDTGGTANAGDFRQARVDLGPWAGHQSVKFKFEATTAGQSRPDQSEFIANDASFIADGHLLTVQGLMPDRFSGLTGEALTFQTRVFEFDVAGNGTTTGIPINIDPAWDSTQVAEEVQRVLANEIRFSDAVPVNGTDFSRNDFPRTGATVRLYNLAIAQTAPTDEDRQFAIVSLGRYNTQFDPDNDGTADPLPVFGVYGTNGIGSGGGRSTGLGGQGIQIDDFVIGLAERGESVGNATPNSVNTLVNNPFFEPTFGGAAASEITEGAYQIEIRSAREYGDPETQTEDNLDKLVEGRVGINERLAAGTAVEVVSSGADILDGDTFTLSNGFDTLTFEFNSAGSVAGGNVAVEFDIDDEIGEIASSIRDSINTATVFGVLGSVATNQGGQLSTGTFDSTDPIVVFHEQITSDVIGSLNFGTHLQGILSGGDVVLGEDNGDLNRLRDQGQLIIESNRISFSSQVGIEVDAGPAGRIGPFNFDNRDEGDRPKPGSVLSTPTLNAENQIPGAIIENNVLFQNQTGILLSGDTGPGAPSAFSRVLNNTIVGSTGDGIEVNEGASPALLNNVLVGNAGVGIDYAGAGETLLRANIFQDNGTSAIGSAGLGTEAINNPTEDIFLNVGGGGFNFAAGQPNFYPAPGSPVIDGSIQQQNDRSHLVAVRDSVGLDPSPIIASNTDFFGQIREDDLTVNNGSGQGQQITIDRGAIDRSDDQGPTAELLVPLDNDSNVIDVDPRATIVQLTEGRMFFFDVQLDDELGAGVDISTVDSLRISLTENGRLLEDGRDYVQSFSSGNNVLRFTPTSGEWRPDAVYVITLNNQDSLAIDATHGAEIEDGDQVLLTDENGNQAVFEYETGNALHVPRGFSFQFTGVNTSFADGEQFVITAPDGTSQSFEINTTGTVGPGNIPIDLTNAGTLTEVRQAFVDAISPFESTLDLAITSVGSDLLQLGVLPGHTIVPDSGIPIPGVNIVGTDQVIEEGQTFIYTTETESATFTFTSNPIGPNEIAFNRTDTPEELAENIASVVASAGLGLDSAIHAGEGVVVLGGTESDLFIADTSALTQIGSAGVTSSLMLEVPAGTSDVDLEGETFTITVGDTAEIFQFTTNPTVPIVGTRVLLPVGGTPTDFAAAIVNAISVAFPTELNPSSDGNVVTVGEQSAIIPPGTAQVLTSIDTSTTDITQSGVSGGAIPIAFFPTCAFNETLVASALAAAIESSALNVTTSRPGGGLLRLVGIADALSVTADGTAPLGQQLSAITDLAGNPLLPNQISGETQFTIVMPNVRLDYGDAPDSYETLLSNNGARHAIIGPFLGLNIDAESGDAITVGSDDAPLLFTVQNATAIFNVTTVSGSDVSIEVNGPAADGDQIELTVDGLTAVFEFVSRGSFAAAGNVPVRFSTTDSDAELAESLLEVIQSTLPQTRNGLNASIDALNVISLQAGDDEDGVPVGAFAGIANTTGLILAEDALPTTSDPADVIGFFNRADSAGTVVPITVTGSGLLDVWIDLNQDGDFFDLNEQVLSRTPVVSGVNLVRVVIPETATTGETWSRFRLSTSGTSTPGGLASDGEVEDYRVSIFDIAAPQVTTDNFTVTEDNTLIVDGLSASTLFANDILPTEEFIQPRLIVDAVRISDNEYRTDNGILTIVDPALGTFTYRPDADYFGPDQFRYRIAIQQNDGPEAVAVAEFAEVNINVLPDNDAPVPADQSITGVEDTRLVIPAAQLLSGAASTNTPSTVFPFDESNQAISVTAISAGGVTIDINNPTGVAITREGGELTAIFDSTGSFIESIEYVPEANFNSDNLPLSSGDRRLDSFEFTLEDDGISILADGTSVQGTPLSANGTARLEITPVNDEPLPRSDHAFIRNQRYINFYADLGLPLPVPTEDTTLVIPQAFLLGNDLSGPITALDETRFVNGNDSAVSIVDVSIVDPTLGSFVQLPNGDIEFTPAENVFGSVLFNYTVQDNGINEDANNVRVTSPLTATVTSSVFLEPVNDVPVPFDRDLSVVETVEPAAPNTIDFTAADLIQGLGVNASSPISVTANSITVPDGQTLQNGETVVITDATGDLQVVEFSTSTTASNGTDLLVVYAETDTAAGIASNLTAVLRAAGVGGRINGSTVSFANPTAVSNNPVTGTVVADASGVTLPDGATIVSGETLTVTDGNGNDLVFEFSVTGVSVNGNIVVAYNETDTSATIATTLENLLLANGIGAVSGAGVGTQSIVRFVQANTIVVDDPLSLLFTTGSSLSVTDGANVIDGETVTITDSLSVTRVVEFNTTGVPTPGTDIIITYAVTDTAADIASNLAASLAGIGAAANGGNVDFAQVAAAVAVPPVSSVVGSSQSISIPQGLGLIDGETIDINFADGSTIVVEFSTDLLPSAGVDLLVTYVPLDTASAVALRLEASLRGLGVGATQVGDDILLTSVANIQVSDQPSAAGDFSDTLPTPFNESIQDLRVIGVQAASGSVDADIDGNGTFNLETVVGGNLELNFAGGRFVNGTYTPPVDYNENTPFAPNDLFTYTIADDGRTEFRTNNSIRNLPDARSLTAGTVTITVQEANDPPVFTTPVEIDILEDSNGAASSVVTGVITDVLPGPVTALDEQAVQNVTLSLSLADSVVPAGLMTQAPVIGAAGEITFFPAADAVGTATYVIRGSDGDLFTEQTVTVNVRPVNDAPRFNPAIAGLSDTDGADDSFSVGDVSSPVITYTLREDNTQALGATTPYFIPLRRDPGITAGFNRVGLLDTFVSGPANELDSTSGGSQTLELFSFPATTAFGGQLTSVFEGGLLVGLNYTPPVNFNQTFGGFDEFNYTVRDDSTVGGETFSLAAGSLTPDRLTASNSVRFVLNPVNDRPEFVLNNNVIETSEDSSLATLLGFATDIHAGPPNTAFDEVDINTGQSVTFALTSLGFPLSEAETFFAEFPEITPDGTLTFQPAPDVFGSFDFEVILTDDGSGNATRGDLISSLPQTITIDVLPSNDPPRAVNPPLEFELREDGFIEILVIGDSVTPGLVDVFAPGPGNESENIIPGGNQTLSLADPLPASSIEGGILTPINDSFGNLNRFLYRPRENFVGIDSFIYTVVDDGASVSIGTGGLVNNDPRIATSVVTLNVTPVNDAPQFSGTADVTSDEDAGVVTIPAWATNVQSGPITAADELLSQNSVFEFVQISENTELFSVAPTATVSGNTATLSYESAPNANGVATFEVRLRDDGPIVLENGDFNVSEPRIFTITIDSVNDAPTFDRGPDLVLDEDSGPFNEIWATNVSAGPGDETGQSVLFEVATPTDQQDLFRTLPTIDQDGILRFTTETNANGTVNLAVRAVDSEGGVTAPVTLQLVINEVNDTPVAVVDLIDTNEDAVLTIPSSQLLANDIDPDLATNPAEQLTVQLDAVSFSVSGAQVSFDSVTGDIVYDPTTSISLQGLAPGESLTDSFSYSVSDAFGATSTRVTVSLDVEGRNDAPVLEADAPTLNPTGPTIIPVLENDSDIDGSIDPTSVIISLQPAFGSVDVDADGVVTYTPFAGFSDVDQFRYSVADDLGLRGEEVFVTISANSAPVVQDDAAVTFFSRDSNTGVTISLPVDIDVVANDFDPDGTLDLTSIQIVDGPLRGQAIPQGDGTIRYVGEPGFIGTDVFQYTIEDNEGRSSEFGEVNVRVIASRLQNPVLNADVNDDGNVSAIDALLVINRLQFIEFGQSGIPVLDTDRGPNFFDVSGNLTISSQDVLQVINELAARAADGQGEAEGELITDRLRIESGSVAEAPIVVAAEDLSAGEKLVDGSFADFIDRGTIDLIANDNSDDPEEPDFGAIDAAFGELL